MEKEILLHESTILSSERTNTIIIKIFEENGERNLCLKGSSELMFAAGMELMSVELPLIFSHEIMIDIATVLGANMMKVVIYDLVEGKFQSRLHILSEAGEEKTVEVGVSDGLAVALKARIPVYTYDSVFEKDRSDRQHVINWWDLEEEFVLDLLNQSPDEQLAACSVEELNKYMEKVLQAEDYKLAARLREIIKNRPESSPK